MMAAVILGAGLCLPAFADQSASWSCTGQYIKVESRTTYWGEGSSFSQTLYSLSRSDQQDASAYTAYFLSVEEDIAPGGSLLFTGTNEVGGSFSLLLPNPGEWADCSDGTNVCKRANARLSYSAGPLKGDDSVVCTLQ
jgi:hypothetical protein